MLYCPTPSYINRYTREGGHPPYTHRTLFINPLIPITLKNYLPTQLLRALLAVVLLFTALPPLQAEDIPFRFQRREVFRMLPVDNETIVFLGNSITNFGVWPEMFGSYVRCVNRGISGNYSGEVFEHLDFILSGKPKKLFLMIGINDYQSPQVVVPNTRRIIETTKRESPNTEIYIQSLLPCNRADRNGMVEVINPQLQALCEEMGVTYIDVYSKLVDRSTTPPRIALEYTNDNLHVTGPGYRAWVSDFAQYVGVAPVFAEGTPTKVNGINTVEEMLLTQYQLLPIQDGDILHIGDYNVKTGEWEELMRNPRFLNRGLGLGWGYTLTLSTLQKVIPHIVKGKPSKIFLQVGAKDLMNANMTAQAALDSYKACVQQIQTLAPEAEIYVESVIPFHTANDNVKVIEFNTLLQAYANEAASSKVTFVDVFAALSKDGVLAPQYNSANTNQSHGINGRGYARWAKTLAEAAHLDIAPIAEPTDAQFTLSNAIADATRALYAAQSGDAPGCYSAEALEAVRNAIASANAVLVKENATEEEMAAAQQSLQTALQDMAAGIILPQASEADEAHWYFLSTPRRASKVLTNIGTGQGARGEELSKKANQYWKLTTRTDGTYNLVSRADGAYLSPDAAANAALVCTTAEPSKGWKLNGVGASGLFTVSNDDVQLHQTNASKSWNIINWGYSASAPNSADDGCLFRFEPAVDEPEVEPEPEPMPSALLAVTDITLDGSAPYKVPEELAAPVLDSEQMTIAIDFTLSENANNFCLVGASNDATNEDFVGILAASSSMMAVRYNNGGGVYSRAANIGTARHRLVVTFQPQSPSYTYYFEGGRIADITAAAPTPHSVNGVNGLYLGGIVCADNANKYPCKGTIHSLQVFPGVLDADQVKRINYEGVVATGISAVGTTNSPAATVRYDLSGRRVSAAARGIIIENGRKVLVQ